MDFLGLVAGRFVGMIGVYGLWIPHIGFGYGGVSLSLSLSLLLDPGFQIDGLSLFMVI